MRPFFDLPGPARCERIRAVVKSSRWLLLRDRERLPGQAERVRLDALLAAKQALMTVYVLREDLERLWGYRQRCDAERFWQHWLQRAPDSRVEPLIRFARRLQPCLEGILAHCRWPLRTGLTEGMNNRIEVIKRMACGFRDETFFFLEIRPHSPDLRDEPKKEPAAGAGSRVAAANGRAFRAAGRRGSCCSPPGAA